MALTEADKELVEMHLARRMKAPPGCPMCSHQAWSLDGPFAAHHVQKGTVAAEASTFITMTCKSCSFFLPFFWANIVEGSKITPPLPGEKTTIQPMPQPERPA